MQLARAAVSFLNHCVTLQGDRLPECKLIVPLFLKSADNKVDDQNVDAMMHLATWLRHSGVLTLFELRS